MIDAVGRRHRLPLYGLAVLLLTGCAAVQTSSPADKLGDQQRQARADQAKAEIDQGRAAAAELLSTQAAEPGIATAVSYSTAGEPAANASSSNTGRAASAEDAKQKDLLQGIERALLGQSHQNAWNEYLRISARRRDDPQVPLAAAVLSLRHNQADLAIRILEEAQPRFPTNAALPRTLGMAYYRNGDFQTSQIALQQAIALDKSCALSYLLMGCTLTRLGQTANAEGYFQQAQLLDPRYAVRR